MGLIGGQLGYWLLRTITTVKSHKKEMANIDLSMKCTQNFEPNNVGDLPDATIGLFFGQNLYS